MDANTAVDIFARDRDRHLAQTHPDEMEYLTRSGNFLDTDELDEVEELDDQPFTEEDWDEDEELDEEDEDWEEEDEDWEDDDELDDEDWEDDEDEV